MSDVKRAIGDVMKKGGGGGGSGSNPFSALSASECSVSAATLNPFGNSDKDGRGDRTNGANGSGGKGGRKFPTIRLEMNLFEPTADSFPEFNFSKLIHEEQKRLKKAQKKQIDRTSNGFLSDPDMDVEVERMAKELERKYGMGSEYATKGKTARPTKLDYYDRGAGYDEEDSFIDNSEAYDELIPQEVETVGGGFYINSGQLEFKQLSNFERPEDAQRMPKPKKRALSTSSESSDEEEPAGEKKKSTQSVPQAQKVQAEKSATLTESQQNRPEAVEHDKGTVSVVVSSEPTVAVLEDEKSRLNGHVAKKQKMVDNGPIGVDQKAKPSAGGESGKEKTNGVKAKSSTSVSAVASVTTAGSVDSSKKEENGGVKELKTTTVKDMLRAKRDSLRKMEQEKKGRSSGSSRVSSSEAEEDGDGGGDEEDEDEENGEGDDEDEEEDEVYGLEEVGSDKNSRESGSDVDMVSDSGSSHKSEKNARGKVMQSVSSTGTVATNGTVDSEGRAVVAPSGPQQPSKERKQKDCKLPEDIPDQLRKDVDALKEQARAVPGNGKLNFFENKIADLLIRIDDSARSSIGSSKKNAIFRHLEAQLSISRQSLQLKLKKIRIRKLENKSKSVLSKLEDVITDTMPAVLAKHQLDCTKVNDLRVAAAAAAQAATSLPNGEKSDTPPNPTPQIRNPKKKYSWNERSRNLLWELYNIRLQTYALVRPRNQTEEEVVAEYLRTKVVPLWPKGWIRYEDIHKELDRRKKALAKSQGNTTVAAQNSTGKKSTPTGSPLLSPGSIVDAALLTGNSINGTKAPDGYVPPRSSTPSSVKSTNSKGGMDVEKGSGSVNNATHHSPITVQPTAASMSPNSSFKRTSDHSITNIMNSPPPPVEKQSGEQRRSFDAIDQSPITFASMDGQSGLGKDSLKRSPVTPVSINLSPGERRHPLASPDRQRWNSREDDSDSSIEIIAEYNVPRAGTAMSLQSGANLSASVSVLQPTATPLPGATANLPVLNKEKYKNLIAGKHKTHGGSGSSAGSSPITAGDIVSPAMGSGKYSKHSPVAGGHGNVASCGIIGFAAPSGNVSGNMLLSDVIGAGGGGSVRLKDTPPPLDVDQIMKDLKELQKQQNVGGTNRKSDSTALQSQQQHVAATASTIPAAASGNVVADYFIDCDMDEDDILFATNYTYSGGHKN
ncbi:ubinuclein-2 isoform X2 [Anopheles funestus]|uniref:ubinuclein-2 isoform X2 n=1 Tax=Anopheles funestus TaxID=62324 RepID=UPI0020C65E44|nr:ubinuclein-2 isoform X2 [Anopheles funestus]